MATDTRIGVVEKFEDFLINAIANIPEVSFATGVTTAPVAGGENGRIRTPHTTSDNDVVGGASFQLQWKAGTSGLYMRARIVISDITDNKFFVGFGDSLAASNESSFSATTDTVTIDTMSDGIGILFDNDATTKVLWCVAGKTDSVTVNQALGSQYNPVATTPLELGVYLSEDRKSAEFYVDGKAVHRVDSTTTLIAAVALAPGVWTYEQGTAFNLDTDYIHAKTGRAST